MALVAVGLGRAAGVGEGRHTCRDRPLGNGRVLAVNGEAVHDWVHLKKAVSSHPGEPVDMTLQRGTETIHKTVTPRPAGDKDAGLIRVTPPHQVVPVGLGEATKISVIAPPMFVYETSLRLAG